MSKTAFFINHGVEVRQFLLSGLAEYIKSHRNVYIITKDIESNALDEYILKYDIEKIILPGLELDKYPWEKYIRVFTDARKRSENIIIYSHFGGLKNENRWFDFFFKSKIIIKFAELFFRSFSTKFYFNKQIFHFLKKLEIKELYVLDYDDLSIKALASAANHLGVRVKVNINTLKTVYINDFISFRPDSVFSWNYSQNELFQSGNKLFKGSVFKPVGNPYHNFLNRSVNTSNKIYEKYNLSVDRQIILYSLINEKVYNTEHLIVKLINDYFNTLDYKQRPIILVRRNPFEESDYGVSEIRKLNNVKVMDHFWERDSKKNWSIQTIEGEKEWRDILQIASISLNIPSMSTIDSIVCGTPVITIGFNEKGEYNSEISHIVDSPFCEEFNKSKFVFKAITFKSFTEVFSKFSSFKAITNKSIIQKSIEIVQSELDIFAH